MAITTYQASQIDNSNAAAQRAFFGSAFKTAQESIATLQTGSITGEVGTHTVVADEQTAGTLTIDTGITITGFIVQIYRAGKLLTGQATSAATTKLTVATNGSTYVVTTGDIINYIVF